MAEGIGDACALAVVAARLDKGGADREGLLGAECSESFFRHIAGAEVLGVCLGAPARAVCAEFEWRKGGERNLDKIDKIDKIRYTPGTAAPYWYRPSVGVPEN